MPPLTALMGVNSGIVTIIVIKMVVTSIIIIINTINNMVVTITLIRIVAATAQGFTSGHLVNDDLLNAHTMCHCTALQTQSHYSVSLYCKHNVPLHCNANTIPLH